MAMMSCCGSSSSVGMVMSCAAVFKQQQQRQGVSYCTPHSTTTSNQHPSFKRLSFPNNTHRRPVLSAAPGEQVDVTTTDFKNIGKTLKKAKVLVIDADDDDDTIQVRVELTGKETQKVFDDVLANLASSAPAVPGFRKLKGGKTSNVPKDFLVRAIGEARVIKFVIQEIVGTTMTEYVEEESLKVKKEFKTIQTLEELESQFEPGKPFGFNATMDMEKIESETNTSSPPSDE